MITLHESPNKDCEGNPKPEGEGTKDDWMFLKAKMQKSDINKQVSFIAESVEVTGSDAPVPNDEFIDIEVTVLSTGITANGRQYILEDLQKNVNALNEEGGLIIAMGKHPDNNQEPDASDNVGVGKVYMQDGKLKARPRIYNTSDYPDMVKRIRLGLVRDLSIEGVVQKFQKVCTGDGCWQRAFGLTIHRAVFVSAGADPIARIEKILESLEGEIKNMTQDKDGKDGAPAPATVVVESAPGEGVAAIAGKAAAEKKPVVVAEATVVEAKAKAAPTEAVTPPATGDAPKPEPKSGVTLDQVLAVCTDMKAIMASMTEALTKAMSSTMGGTAEPTKEAVQPTKAEVKESATIAQTTVTEPTKPTVTESQERSDAPGVEKPPRVKESKASPTNTTSSFFEDVKKLVR